jgi:hypothetical protein
VLWGEFDRETQAFGLATTGGFISTTGIAGLTLGGGQGWLAGKHGFAIDNLLSVDVVTAEGALRTASATQHEDLFWAMRGAGHNFGVVTSFEYRLHSVITVLGGMVVHPFDRATDVLRFYREFTAELPDELTTAVALLTGPDGNRVAAMVVCYVGSLDEGEHVLAPLRRFGAPVADTIAPIPYTAQQTMMDAAFPYGRLNYWKSSLTDHLSDGVIAALVDYAGRMPSPLSAIRSRTSTVPTAGWARPRWPTITAISATTLSSRQTRPTRLTRSATCGGRARSTRCFSGSCRTGSM